MVRSCLLVIHTNDPDVLLWMKSSRLSVVIEALVQLGEVYFMTLWNWALYAVTLPMTFSLLATTLVTYVRD